MEAIVQFLGIVAVTVGWLAALLAGGVHGIHLSRRIVKKSSARHVGVKRTRARVSGKTSRPRHRRGPGKTIGLRDQSPEGRSTAPSAPNPSPAVSACPSCGLVAPDELMVEHFSGSPSHEKGKAPGQPLEEVLEAKPNTPEQSGDTIVTMRHIIQILIPPRAFGRRHLEKTENPLSEIVHRLETARKTPVKTLGSEVKFLERSQEALARTIPDSGAS